MALVPDLIERYTTNLLLPIYKYAAARWHEALNNAADLIDTAIGEDRVRLTALEIEHNNDGSHADVNADTVTLGGIKRAAWGTLVASGTATSGTVNSLTDNGADWGTQALDKMVVSIVGGAGSGQLRKILSHTESVITPTEDWATAPNATSKYEIYATSNQTLNQSVIAESAQMALGNVANPVLSIPLCGSLDLDRGKGTVTFDRPCTATYITRDGVLKTAAIDEPRFEDSMLLWEGESTNDLIYSEEFDNAAWVKQNATITANDATAPDGQVTADKLIEDSSALSHGVSQSLSSATDNEDYTLSVFAALAERNWIQLEIITKSGSSMYAYFNLSTGAIGAISVDATARISKSLVNGFYRCEITADVGTGGVNVSGNVVLADADNSNSYSGDGVSGAHIFGGQIERKNSSTSYIFAAAVSVTRNKELVYLTNNDQIPLLFKSMTVVVDIVSLDERSCTFLIVHKTGGGTIALSKISDVAGQDMIVYQNGGSSPRGDKMFVGVKQRAALTVNDANQIIRVWQDGFVTNNGVDFYNNPDVNPSLDIYIGGGLNTAAIGNVKVANIKIYDRVLTDTEVQLA